MMLLPSSAAAVRSAALHGFSFSHRQVKMAALSRAATSQTHGGNPLFFTFGISFEPDSARFVWIIAEQNLWAEEEVWLCIHQRSTTIRKLHSAEFSFYEHQRGGSCAVPRERGAGGLMLINSQSRLSSCPTSAPLKTGWICCDWEP